MSATSYKQGGRKFFDLISLIPLSDYLLTKVGTQLKAAFSFHKPQIPA